MSKSIGQKKTIRSTFVEIFSVSSRSVEKWKTKDLHEGRESSTDEQFDHSNVLLFISGGLFLHIYIFLIISLLIIACLGSKN